MARGRGYGSGPGTRRIDIRTDPISFRLWWEQADQSERLTYNWPHDLDYLDLSELDLSQVDLSDRSLQETDLSHSVLSGANITGADFSYANLTGTLFDPDAADVAVFELGPGQSLDELCMREPDEEIKEGDNTLQLWYKKGTKTEHNLVGPSTRLISPGGVVLSEVYRVDGELHNESGPAIRSWHPNGTLKKESFYLRNKRHNKDQPAVREWDETGRLILEEWYNSGELDRQGGPALTELNSSGVITKERYYKNGQFHRDQEEGPALIDRFDDGQTKLELYYKNDLSHNSIGAASKEFFETGQIKTEIYYEEGKRHRLEGAAFTQWFENGNLAEREWNRHNQVHREGGAAYEKYHLNGQIKEAIYYQKDVITNTTGPARQTWYDTGALHQEIYAVNGLIHRDRSKGAAKTQFYPSGAACIEDFIQNGNYDNQGPSSIRYDEAGNLREEQYLHLGPDPEQLSKEEMSKLSEVFGHRDWPKINDPIECKQGSGLSIGYEFAKGYLHNEQGPASIKYHPNGQKESEEYRIYGSPPLGGELYSRSWHENGQLASEIFARARFSAYGSKTAKASATETEWHENGSLKEERYFQGEGNMAYKRVAYDVNGKIIKAYDNSL